MKKKKRNGKSSVKMLKRHFLKLKKSNTKIKIIKLIELPSIIIENTINYLDKQVNLYYFSH